LRAGPRGPQASPCGRGPMRAEPARACGLTILARPAFFMRACGPGLRARP